MTPKEKSQEMTEALKFCLSRNLMSNQELKQTKTSQQRLELGCKAIMRKALYLKAHPEE